jgi:hypothetical protein
VNVAVSCVLVACGGEGAGTDTCPHLTHDYTRISHVNIPGQGIWPDELVPVIDGTPGPDDIFTPPTQAEPGCYWTDLAYQRSQAIECFGPATIAHTSNPDELEATLDDGAVARFTLPGGPLPAAGRVDLSLGRHDTSVNPFNTYARTWSSGRDAAGRLIWLVHDSSAGLEQSLGAPVEAVESCTATYHEPCEGRIERTVYDHVVKSTPEQRIPAGEPALVNTPNGTYLVTWYSETRRVFSGEFCSDGPFYRPEQYVRAVLQSE